MDFLILAKSVSCGKMDSEDHPPDPALLFLLSLHHLMLRAQRQRKENRLSAKLLFLHLPVLFGKFWASDANTWVSVSSSAKMGWREVPASFF